MQLLLTKIKTRINMKQLQKSKIAFGVFATAAVVTLGTSVFTSAFATTETSTGVVEVAVDETLTITLSEDVVLIEADAATNGGFAQGSTQVTVGTNNQTGASLTVQMDAANNNLLGTGTNTSVIASTSTTTLGTNTWGYEAFLSGGSASGLWNAMPTNTSSPDVIFSDLDSGAGINAPGSTTWTFNFGTQIDYTLPADTYSGTILYTATTN
jgi:hypothetical protein